MRHVAMDLPVASTTRVCECDVPGSQFHAALGFAEVRLREIEAPANRSSFSTVLEAPAPNGDPGRIRAVASHSAPEGRRCTAAYEGGEGRYWSVQLPSTSGPGSVVIRVSGESSVIT